MGHPSEWDISECCLTLQFPREIQKVLLVILSCSGSNDLLLLLLLEVPGSFEFGETEDFKNGGGRRFSR